jgi:transglutaminase-like putative cysteine protease
MINEKLNAETDPNKTMVIRVGCRLVYYSNGYTPILLIVRPHSEERRLILEERLTVSPKIPYEEFPDWQGNTTQRWVLPPGSTTICHDALVTVSSQWENVDPPQGDFSISQLPASVLRYTLPSRYCESDKMLAFAFDTFGHLRTTGEKTHAICDWVHANIKYVTYSGRPDISAVEILNRGFGVCRDFAHVGITLCRALNIPARYVSGHLPDVGVLDPGSPMDFHAYYEAYIGESWYTYDPRFNSPRIGRIKIAHGLDAVDGALTTTYGQAPLTFFEAWAYQVDPSRVSVGDPIDLAQRLDGTPEIRFI